MTRRWRIAALLSATASAAFGSWLLFSDRTASTGSAKVIPPPAPETLERRWGQAPLQRSQGSATISGTVVGPSGPLAQVTVIAVRVDAEEDLSLPRCAHPCERSKAACPSTEAQTEVAEWVATRRGEAPPVARTTSAADGTFALEGLEHGTHRLWAVSPTEGVAWLREVQAGDQAAQIRFGTGRRVLGRLVDAEDRPLAGVGVTGFFPETPRYFDAQTDAEGIFDFGVLPPHPFVWVAKHGSALRAVLRQGEPRSTTTLSPPVPVTVRVLLQGQPHQAALVLHESGHLLQLRTGSDGVAPIQASPFLHAIEATDGKARAYRPFDTQLESADGGFTLELEDAITVIGTVVSSAGTPVDHAMVRHDEFQVTVFTDAHGKYRLLLPARAAQRPLSLAAEAVGYNQMQSNEVAVSPSGTTVVDFTLEPFADVMGVVLDPEGNGLPDAIVSVGFGRRLPRRGISGADDEVTRSGPDGRFALHGGQRGTNLILANHERYGMTSVEAELPGKAAELRYAKGAELFGSVLDEHGAPATVHLLLLRDADNELRDRMQQDSRDGTVEADGGYLMSGVADGEWMLIASDDQQVVRASASITLAKAERRRVDLVLPDGLSLSGKVTRADGTPVRDSSVLVQLASTENELLTRRLSRTALLLANRQRVTSDALGRFEARHLPAGQYSLTVNAGPSRQVVRQMAQAGDHDITFTLPTEPAVIGRVVDEAGRPLTHFRVNRREVQSERGEFRVSVSGFESTVEIGADSLPTRELTIPRSNEAWPFDLGTVELRPATPLSVAVNDARTGRPLAGATVVVLRDDNGRLVEGTATRVTDASGKSQFLDLPPDELTLRATAPGHARTDLSLPKATRQATLSLEPEGRLVVTLRIADGGVSNIGTVTVRAADGGFTGFDAVPTSEGVYEVAGLPAGQWQVRADLGPGRLRPEPRWVQTSPGTSETVEMLEPSGGVHVTVSIVDAHGDRAVGMSLLVPGEVPLPTDAASLRNVMSRSARVQMTAGAIVPPGIYTLIAIVSSAGNDSLAAAQRVEVTAAREQVLTFKLPEKMQTIRLSL